MKKMILVLLLLGVVSLTGCVFWSFNKEEFTIVNGKPVLSGRLHGWYASANENIKTKAKIELPGDVNIVLERDNKESPASAIALGRGVADATTGGVSEGIRNATDPNN